MAKKFVDVQALNLRSAPIVNPSTQIAILHLGQEIDVVDSAGETAG